MPNFEERVGWANYLSITHSVSALMIQKEGGRLSSIARLRYTN